MKRILLSVSVICLLAGQASAGLFTLDYSTALSFRQITGGGSSGLLNGVYNGDDPWPYQNEYLPAEEYPSPMQGAVGFVGSLSGNLRWMRIGATTGDFTDPTYDSFGAWLANDDNSAWEVRLVTNDVAQDSWTPLAPGESVWLTWGSAALTMIGFDVRLNTSLLPKASPSDSFNISAVPLPAGVLLGMLGLGVAGMKLRKSV